jgi:hypothetical protein
MASTWAATANNETISFNNLQNAVDTGVFAQKSTIPVSNEQITKADADACVYINTLFGPYASKASNQLVVKSNMECILPVINSLNLLWDGIANNETTSSPIQLIVGFNNNFDGRIFRSTDYGQNYSSVLIISDALRGVKFMPAFRHASYLSVPPFLAVGVNGRIVTNSVTDCTSWITVSSPTTNTLFDVGFNSIGTGIIVGLNRILRANTNNRINAWSIVNSVSATWRAIASDGSIFVVVGDNNSIITGNSLGGTWTTRSMPPLMPGVKDLRGVTYHSDGFFYAVGFDTSSLAAFMMRSNDGGLNWSVYLPTGDSFIGAIFSITSVNNVLFIGGTSYSYQIFNNVATRCGANTGGVSMEWLSIVKDANSNGFDMAGLNAASLIGGYSNF